MLDAYPPRLAVWRVYLHYVKPWLKLTARLAEPQLRRHDYPLLLGARHEFPCLGIGRAFAQLYLNEGYIFSARGDDVYLPAAAAIIPRKNFIAPAAKILRGALFAPAPKLAACHQCIFRRKLMRCIGVAPNSRMAA